MIENPVRSINPNLETPISVKDLRENTWGHTWMGMFLWREILCAYKDDPYSLLPHMRTWWEICHHARDVNTDHCSVLLWDGRTFYYDYPHPYTDVRMLPRCPEEGYIVP